MKRILVAICILLIVSSSAFAFTPREELRDTSAAARARGVSLTAVSWVEDDVLYVAMGNEGRSSERLTIEPIDNHPVFRPFDGFTVILPGNSVMIESVALNDRFLRRSSSLDKIIVSTRSLGEYEVTVQKSEYLAATTYVASSNTSIEVDVDLAVLLEDKIVGRIVVDQLYDIIGSSQQGRITISSLDGGFVHLPYRNEIVYRHPRMTLKMTTPRNEFGLLTFDIYHVPDGSRPEMNIAGPLVLVYNDNMRFIDNTSHASRFITK